MEEKPGPPGKWPGHVWKADNRPQLLSSTGPRSSPCIVALGGLQATKQDVFTKYKPNVPSDLRRYDTTSGSLHTNVGQETWLAGPSAVRASRSQPVRRQEATGSLRTAAQQPTKIKSSSLDSGVTRLPETSCLFGLENIYSQSQTCTHGLPGRRLLLKHIGGKSRRGRRVDQGGAATKGS